MKRDNMLRDKLKIVVPCFFFLVLLTANVAASQPDSLTVIANPKGAAKTMTFRKLTGVFKGEKPRWGNGTKIVIALMKTSTPVGALTAKKVYQMTANALNRYWVTMVFRGKTRAPKSFDSEEELRKFVAKTPGAIGAVSSASADSSTLQISIDGKTVW